MASSESAKDLLKRQKLEEPKLMQLDMVLYEWFTAVCAKGNWWLGLQ
jgi:hypothetical protein